MTARPRTCIDDTNVEGAGMNQWIARCGCGKEWRLGDTKAVCYLCVEGKCNHAKSWVTDDQMRLI